MKHRLRARSSAALSSSIYMVCRRKEREKLGFFGELKAEAKKQIHEKLMQFWQGGISGPDLLISAIGAGFEIFSRFEKIKNYDGELVSTITLLDFIREECTDFILVELLGSTATALDNVSRFYLLYRWLFANAETEFEEARKLALATGIDLDSLWKGQSRLIERNGAKITLLQAKERGNIIRPESVIDCAHSLTNSWENGDREAINASLHQFGKDRNDLALYCQALAQCLPTGNREKVLVEGLLLMITSNEPTRR